MAAVLSVRDTLPRLAGPLLVAALYYAGAAFTLLATGGADGLATIWPANAVLVSAMLIACPSRRLGYLVACAIASLAANLAGSVGIGTAMGFTIANMAEAALVVALVGRLRPPRPFLATLPEIASFVLAAVVAAACAASIAALGALPGRGGALWLSWFTTDLLGLLVIVPPGLMLAAAARGDPAARLTATPIEAATVLGMVAVLNCAFFVDTQYPLLFLALAGQILATARLGPVGAALGLAVTAVAGSTALGLGRGLFQGIPDPQETVLFFQAYMVVAFAASLPLSSLIAAQRRMVEEAERSARFHRSVVDRSRAILFETDMEGRWRFLSQTWTEMTGVAVEQAIGRTFIDVLDPADVPRVVADLAMLHRGAIDECRSEGRYRGADGAWHWASLRARRLEDAAGRRIGSYGAIFDITERVAADEARAQSDRLYRLLADSSSDMIFRVGVDGVRRYASPAVMQVLGYHPAELVGRPALELLHPDDRAATLAVVEAIAAGATDRMALYRQRHRDGHYVWLEASYRFVADPVTGRPAEFISTVRDVSRRQAAELKALESGAGLAESHRLLSLTEIVAEVGHWRVDLVSRERLWSPGMLAIHGFAPDTPIDDALARSIFHPDEAAMMRGELERLSAQGGVRAGTVRITRPDGGIRHMRYRMQREDAQDGTPLALFGIVQDVTERVEAEIALRRSEAGYRLLAEHATDLIFRVGDDGRYSYVSPAAMALTGYRPSEMLGQPPRGFVHPDDGAALEQAVRGLLEGPPGASAVLTYRRRRKDGDWLWLEARARTAQGPGGRNEIVGIARDVSDRKRIEAELTASREAAELAAREAQQLAATDVLTGLANRRQFMDRLAAEVSAAQALGTPLSIAAIDVDYFKRVNDAHGHAAGDAVLRAIAATASRVVRGQDVTGRIGGEEFAILMPGAGPDAAAAVGERLRLAVEGMAHHQPGLPPITISLGVAALVPGQEPQAFLAKADAALYAAKAAGRNCLKLAA